MIATQKFCAMVDGNVWRLPKIPPLPSPTVSAQVAKAAPVPLTSPENAPCPVVRFQNIPSRNVPNKGAFTNPNTNCSKSMMLL